MISGVLLLCLVGACSADKPKLLAVRDAEADAVDAGLAIDAGLQPLMDFVHEQNALYDRRIRATCPCLVANGTYQTESECLQYGLSGPDWDDCETMALTGYYSADTRAQTQCYHQYLQDAAECTEAAACDETKLATCGVPDQTCLAASNMFLNLILLACPDTGLLSRLHP